MGTATTSHDGVERSPDEAHEARSRAAQGTIEDRAPHRATRDSLITLIILGQLLRLHLIPFRPLEIAVFIRAISQAHLAIAKADAQLLALQRAKDAGR